MPSVDGYAHHPVGDDGQAGTCFDSVRKGGAFIYLWKLARRINLSIGVILILAVNAIGALPEFFKGAQHPVGPDAVSVYVSNGESGEETTPVERLSDCEPRGFKDTGQRVQVYVAYDYKHDIIVFYPRWTLLIMLGMGVVHLVLRLLRPRSFRVKTNDLSDPELTAGG